MNRSLSPSSPRSRWFTRVTALVMTAAVVTCSGASLEVVGASASTTVTATHQTIKAPGKPTAKLTAPKTAVVGGLVTVHTKGSKSPAHLASFVLDFGDKTAKVHGTTIAPAKSHRYAKPGHYTITLRLTDRAHRVAKVTRKITVHSRKAQLPTATTHGTGALPPTKDFSPAPGLAGGDALPATVDLTSDAVAVGDQGQVGSCVTWAIDYAMMGWYSNHQGIAGQPFAPMYAYSQATVGGALGGSYPSTVLGLAQSEGNDTVAHYGSGSYLDWQDKPTAAQKANAAGHKISGYTNLFAHSTGFAGPAGAYAIKAQLAAGRPVAFGILLPKSKAFDSFRGAGVFDDPATAFSGGHEMLALGYDQAGLLVQNSWGTGWGNQGFVRLSWHFVENAVDEADIITGLVTAQAVGDSGAPVATAPTQTMATGTSIGTGVPVTVSWSGSDDSGAVASYDLWASTDGGAWTQQTLPSVTATSISYQLAIGSRYRFAVQARDAAGNLSAWSYGTDFAVANHAETDTAIQWSNGWTYQAWSGALGGQQATSVTPGAWAYFTFTGSNVAWVTTWAINRGQANVYIDGKFIATVDLGSSTTTGRAISAVLNAGSSGSHTMEIDVVGTSGRPNVDVDSFIVLA